MCRIASRRACVHEIKIVSHSYLSAMALAAVGECETIFLDSLCVIILRPSLRRRSFPRLAP